MGPLKSQNTINITLPAEGTLLNFLVLGDDVFPLHTLTFASRFIVVHPSSLMTISCRKASPSSWYCYKNCMLLWHPPCTNSVILKVLVDDGICGSTPDVQLVRCISDSNPSVLLNQGINSFNTVCHLWSGKMARAVFINACSDILEPFHPLVHLPLHNIVFSVLCWHSSVNLGGFYPL